jgi:hypothetical protein
MHERKKDMANAKTTGTDGTRKAAGKSAPKKTVTKKAVAKKTVAMKGGDRYVCGVCGLGVTVDTACGCEENYLVCCKRPMKKKG